MSDPVLAALDELEPRRSGPTLRVDMLFGERPDILDRIRQARDAGNSAEAIARALTKAGSGKVCEGAVRHWLEANGGY